MINSDKTLTKSPLQKLPNEKNNVGYLNNFALLVI